jgi:hypothetical protein
MASRAELVSIIEELKLNKTGENITIENMKKMVREWADRNIGKMKSRISADNLSVELRKFLLQEYDYIILDKDKKELDENLNLKEK